MIKRMPSSIAIRLGRFVRTFIWIAIVTGNAGHAQTSAVSFSPDALQSKQAYFSQLPFEHIDMVNGNLLLTFVDLDLPGDAGMNLRIIRTFNEGVFQGDWRIGIDGVPMRIVQPDGTGVGGTAPVLLTADGGAHVANARSLDPNETVFITEDFWRYTKTSRTLELPNGWAATYEAGNNLTGGAMLLEVHDSFGNSITPIWEPGDIRPLRLLGIDQTVDGQTRHVDLTYDSIASASAWMPLTMSFDGRTWQYAYQDRDPVLGGPVRLTDVTPPAGGTWHFDYSDGLSVTTPAGGTAHYTLTDHVWPDGANRTVKIVTGVDYGGRDVSSISWTLSYNPEAPGFSSDGSFGEADSSTGKRLVFRHDWRPGSGRWALTEKTLSDGSGILRRFSRSYQELGYTDTPAGVTASVPTSDSIDQDGRTFTTTYEYGGDLFGDYHTPFRITESGDATRTTTRTFLHNLGGQYILTKIASEIIEATCPPKIDPAIM